MTVQTFQSKPTTIQAVQWDGSYDRADELWEWTTMPALGLPGAVKTMFMVLGEDDAYQVFRCYDEDMELEPNNEVDQLRAQGFTAMLYVEKSGQWANLRTFDWIVAEGDGVGHYPCTDEVLRRKYEEVEVREVDPIEYTLVEGEEPHARPVK